jgi:hypothetical protein
LHVAKSRSSKVQPRLRLASDWTPQRNATNGQIVAEGRLWNFIERIAQSRREGKNRRDGATVSTRVLRLIDTIGQTLSATETGDTGISEEDKKLLSRKQERRKSMQTRAHL